MIAGRQGLCDGMGFGKWSAGRRMKGWIRAACVACMLGRLGDAWAQTDSLSPVLEAVARHPTVVAQQFTVQRSQVRIGEAAVARSPTLDFQTRGKFPIASEATEAASRVSDIDRNYLDGVFSLNQLLFDAGRVERSIDAAGARAIAERLQFAAVFESQLVELLSDAMQRQQEIERLGLISQHLETMDSAIESAKLRYQSGVGTLDDIRVLELVRLDIVRLREETLWVIELRERRIRNAYQLNPDGLEDPLQVVLGRLPVQFHSELVFENTRTAQVAARNLEALQLQAQSVGAERWPEVRASVVGVVYDLFGRAGEEYEVYAGLDVRLPLLDGRSISTRLEGLAIDRSVAESTQAADAERIRQEWESARLRFMRVEAEQARAQRTVQERAQQVDSLRQQLASVKPVLVELALAENQWFESKQAVLDLRWEAKSLRLQLADLSDSLLSSLAIDPLSS